MAKNRTPRNSAKDRENQPKSQKIRSQRNENKRKFEFEVSRKEFKKTLSKSENFVGRVVEVHKKYCFICTINYIGEDFDSLESKDIWLATIANKHLNTQRSERNFLCVGDLVIAKADKDPGTTKTASGLDHLPRCVILQRRKRENYFFRMDPINASRRQVFASNMDQVILTASLESPPIKWGFIDRALAVCEAESIEVIPVINKIDLAKDEQRNTIASERLAYYESLGYRIIKTQCNHPEFEKSQGFSDLKELLQGRISLIFGQSGVGKSTLVNQFDPEILQCVEENDDIFYKGRHTTTFASFIRLGIGGYLIDSPGIKTFSTEKWDRLSLSFYFRDIQSLREGCEFRECSHVAEEKCAVKDAIATGKMPKWRYQSYLSMLGEEYSAREGRQGTLEE